MTDSKRVLVIDDDIGIADLLADFCESLGCEVRCVTDAREALGAAIAFRPHLVTLDLEMPYINGYDVLRLLRAHPATNATPVMIVTGWLAERDVSTLNVPVALSKPVPYSVFAHNLNQLLGTDHSKR